MMSVDPSMAVSAGVCFFFRAEGLFEFTRGGDFVI